VRFSAPPAYLLSALLVLAALPAPSLDFSAPGTPEDVASALVAAMDDGEALAQTFMLGWVGADPSPLILRWIEERRIGGVKIFGWNTDDTGQLAAAVGKLQSAALGGPQKIPLLMATDQEGGWIRHVKGDTSETPGNMAIGASGFPRDAYLSGYYIGRELAALGINMNFAPAVDLYTNRDSVLLGPRTFGDDPVRVGTLGAAFAKGLSRAGIIATAKHFPGHGDTEDDSHGVLPEIPVPFEVLWDRELIPYRMLSREGVPVVMSGHLAFPQTPGGYVPASLSPWFMTDILRQRIGFAGLIITDDLLMNGATATTGSLARSAEQALRAGNDILLFSRTPELDDPVWTRLADAMAADPAFRARVRDAARRVLALKLRYLRGTDAPPLIPDPAEVKKRVPDPEGRAFFLDLAVRSVTLAAGDPAALPLSAETAGRVLLAGQFEAFFSAGSALFPDASRYRFSYNRPEDGGDEAGDLYAQARRADTVVFCLANAYSLSLLRRLENSGPRVIVLSVLSPVYLEKLPWIDAAVALYSYAPESFIAGFSFLGGRIGAQGRMPYAASGNRR